MSSSFSSALQLTDLDDFITPSQNCVKPEIISKSSNKKAKIQVTNDGTYIEYEGNEGKVLESAKISLADCLACSGCITSAESVLITAQSTKEFMSSVAAQNKTVVVSISPQSRASIAARYKLGIKETHKKLITLFKKLGAQYVFDTSFSREFSLLESAAEFVARYKKNINSPLPMLASACPGWICYAEKTHGEYVLPYISTTKSPQQIMGTLVKYYFAKQLDSADKIYHTTVMPCYDKKLEASRDDFYNDVLSTRDVDCVLASGEILDLINMHNIDFKSLEESPLDTMFSNVSEEGEVYGLRGGSGGYLEFIFKYAAKELFNVTVDSIQYKQTKGNSMDYRIATLEVEGKEVLSFATAYGFKNIQNVLRRIKRGQKQFDFIEIMACPGGCLNGGGQIKPEKTESSKELLKRVEDVYHEQKESSPVENAKVLSLYEQWLNGVFSPDATTHLHTQYHMREKLTNALAIKW